MKIKSNVSTALLKGVYAGTFVDLAVDADGNLITIIRGAAGNDVAVDASGYLSTAIKGKHGATYSDVGVDASGNLIAIIRGAAGNDVGVDASGNLTAIIRGSTGVINQDGSGNLVAAMKGLEGANVRDIAVDASGQMISIMKGAAGNNVAVDASGYLSAAMKGLEGANVRDIAVDGSGNMISVMKGDYEGALKTWKVDTDGRGEMFISDPSDVWGNVNPMGLGEHGVRVHAPPMVFDKRGNLLRWIDFESATQNYDVSTSGSPTYARSDITSGTGDFSYKISVDNTEYVVVKYETNDFHIGRLGQATLFTSADADLELQVYIGYFDGVTTHAGILQYALSTGLLKYIDDNAVFQTIATLSYHKTIHNFSTAKIVVDFNTDEYVRALVFGNEYDLSSIPLYTVLDAGARRLETYTRLKGTAAGVNTGYIDNILLTENEPEN